MLFVNEEFEESQPVFSKPKKVRPETDDEMVRRIKSMLGEYVHENEIPANDSTELEAKETAELTTDQPSDILPNLGSPQLEEKFEGKDTGEDVVILNEANELSGSVEENVKDKDVSLSTNETTDNQTDNSHNSASEESGASSRRCSLKRQCKEKISLLDYNPMFTIRTKRTKGSSSYKGKSAENLDIPTLKKCPEIQPRDISSEVPNQDPPPLLDSVLTPSYNSSPSGKEYANDYGGNFECSKNVSKSKEDSNFLSEELSSPKAQIKSKKQQKKKKKKVLYESLPVPEVSALSASAQDCKEQSVNSKVGSCQIKNGIIKIRLSKLPDSNKDLKESNYEVSLLETNALNGCKPLSVPLSPLAPDVYSAYCTSYKRKGHSSNKARHGGKKKKVTEALLEEEENNSTSSVQTVDAVTISCSETPEIEDNVNTNFLSVNNKIEESEVNESFQEPLSGSMINDSADKSSSSETITLSENDSSGTENHTNNDLTTLSIENNCELSSLMSSNQPESHNPKIMCSINLSLINRLPVKSNIYNHTDKSSDEGEVKEELSLESSFDVKKNQLDDPQVFYKSERSSTDVKMEMSPPPACDLNRIELHCLEAGHSPTLNLQGDHKDDSCPNLTPAYSFETFNTEDNCNKISCENLSDAQESPLYSGANDLMSDHQGDQSTKADAPFFHQHSHVNKVKIEVPDAILSNHERWNEYKEYKWCRDFPDVNYNNGSPLFKEQLSYNITNHGFWQDPELKKQYSSEYYLNEAKKLKHQADKEVDRMVQAMKYLEAVLYFILTGNAMEHSYIDTDRVHTMYKETLALIRFISSKFQKLHNASCRNIDNKLTVLSLRCQSLLYLKMYQLRRDEVRYLHRNITTLLKSENGSFPDQVSPPHLQLSRQNMKHSQVSPSHQASPCSLTPSPAGSVASVSSQSSGYSSSELGWSSTNAPNSIRAQVQYDMYSDAVTVPRNKYKMLQQQSAYLANLHLCHDLWEHADYLSSKEHSREFFLELDEECGCLSLHSPFSALVHYVRKGLYKLKDGT